MLLIPPKGSSSGVTDVTYAKKKKSDTIIDGCYAAYIMCIARCAMTGDHGCPHCEPELFRCHGIDMVTDGITLQ